MAFKQMKTLIAELPMLITPKEKEELVIYLAAAKEAVSVVLMTERDANQMPLYFVSRALQGPKINYTPMEKLILALMLSNLDVVGRLLKWRFELEEHDIHYRPRTSVKRQILADFIIERPEDDPPDTPMEDKEELPDLWILFTDGSLSIDGSGAGLILINLEGMEFKYALRFRFNATNNEAEYEALIVGLRITKQMGVINLQANVDSRLVDNQVNKTYVAKEPGMIEYLEKVKNLTSTFKEFSMKQGIDIAGPFLEGPGKVMFLIVVIDYFTKWIEAKPVIEEISHVLWAHRTMIKSSNEETPFSLTYGTEAMILVEIGMPTLRIAKVDMIKNDEALEINLDLLDEKREQAAIQEAKSKAMMKKIL
nr:reverse transcriptase domain-containing protein [Tanacetum cinerariifolium]GEX46518.1 reverse transcriptase domain-containing protein [Tanacetum cinerariifolium]